MRLFRLLAAAAIVAGSLAGCTTATAPPGEAAPPAAAGDLAGTKWELVHFQSSDDSIGTIKPADPTVYTMELNAGGELALRLDCNRAMGKWKAHPTGADQGHITFDAPAMTRAFCGEASMDTRIARDLAFVVSYVLRDDTLNLALKMDSGIYTWRRLAR